MWSVVCTEGRLWKRKRPGRLGLPFTENYQEIIPEWQWGLIGAPLILQGWRASKI